MYFALPVFTLIEIRQIYYYIYQIGIEVDLRRHIVRLLCGQLTICADGAVMAAALESAAISKCIEISHIEANDIKYIIGTDIHGWPRCHTKTIDSGDFHTLVTTIERYYPIIYNKYYNMDQLRQFRNTRSTNVVFPVRCICRPINKSINYYYHGPFDLHVVRNIYIEYPTLRELIIAVMYMSSFKWGCLDECTIEILS